MKGYTFIALIGFASLIWSCETQVVQENLPEHVAEAEAYAGEFYSAISEGDTAKIVSMLGRSVPEEKGKEIINRTHLILGDIYKIDVEKVQTVVTTKDGRVSKEYDLEIKATYANGIALESINVKNEKDQLKVEGYYIEVE